MKTQLRKMGNSQGVIIPQVLLAQLGVGAGGNFDMSLEGGEIKLRPLPATIRTGWADASATIAAAGDDQVVWPEIGNVDDAYLTW